MTMLKAFFIDCGMRKFLVLIFLCTSLITYGQTVREQDLTKYCYLLVMLRNDSASGFASGFFFRQNSKLLFVTAKHNVSPYDFTTGEPEPAKQGNNAIVVRVTDSLEKTVFKKIELEEYLKGHDTRNITAQPDLEIFDVSGIVTSNVNSVEKFVNQKWNPRTGGSTFHFGYDPTDMTKSFVDSGEPKQVDGRVMKDSRKNGINKKFYYVIEPAARPGNSGAPLFAKDTKTGQIFFAGVIVAGNAEMNLSKVVRPAVVMRSILSRFGTE